MGATVGNDDGTQRPLVQKTMRRCPCASFGAFGPFPPYRTRRFYSLEPNLDNAKSSVVRLARRLIFQMQEKPMSFLRNPLFWQKKIRIAVLTLATFMALC